jgi:hypothetical protein
MRSNSGRTTWSTLTGGCDATTPPAFDAFEGATVGSSAIVFHSPQAGQRPIHLGDSYPHSLQKYAFLSFAIVGILCKNTTNYKDFQIFRLFSLPLYYYGNYTSS